MGTVIHSAASVAFDLPIEEARAINVEGTRRVLDFAGAVPDLQRVAYVSTAYVAGDRRGTVYEDDRETGTFRNSYERSKHEAEAVVRSSTAAVDDRAPEHRRGREHDRLDRVLQRALRAAAGLRRRRLSRASRAPALAGRRGAGRLRRRCGRGARAPPRRGGRDLPPDRGLAGLERRGDHVADDGALRAPRAAARARRAPTAASCTRSSCAAWRRRRAGCWSAARSTSRTSRCACATTTRAPARCSSRWGSPPRAWRTTSGASSSSRARPAGASSPLDRGAAAELAGTSSDVRTPRAQPAAGRGRNARVRKRTATAVSSGSCWIER